MKGISAPLQNKTMNAEIAGLAGTLELKTWSMASINVLDPEEIKRAKRAWLQIEKPDPGRSEC